MRYGTLGTVFGAALLCLAMVGCATLPSGGKPAPAAAAAKAPAVAPTPTPASVPALTLDPREERRLVKELLRDVDAYHRRLQEKDVEQAAMFVEPEQRPAFQDGLWDLVARYKIESADVVSYQLFPQSDNVVTASVKVMRTLFARNSVKPEKSELWMSWENRGPRWVLRPQKQK
ncbi:MAG: hypothetical protein P1P84_23705 [Deferrisomatales bacterium]|nr:hypothetical protein [Deferrisomatales bacterium]